MTSSVPGEGKTNTAVNLALSLAEAGLSTCLVDGDLRRPCVASTFGLVQDAGLTTVLIGQARIEDVMQQAGGRLSVLASGAVPPNPTELLASARMEEVLRELADTYEVVIVDTAPLLPVADTLGLASFAQGALLVVRAAKTSREQVRTAAESLDRVSVRILGTVFNMAPAPRGSGYGTYGSYGELPAPRVSDPGRRPPRRHVPRAGNDPGPVRLHGQRAPLGARRTAAGREASARFGRPAEERRNAGPALVRHGGLHQGGAGGTGR